jgi:hypothetical protein
MHYFNLYLIRALLVIVLCLLPSSAPAVQQSILQDRNIVVIHDPALNSAAREITRIYPDIKLELEESFQSGLDIRPQVLLVADTQAFQELSGNNLFVAFAVSEKNLIVIDYSRMSIHPFTLSVTLKHELCHLLLHQHISRENLPKWLDEGICQWISDGIGELFVNRNPSQLDAAVMSGRIIPLQKLADYFPRDKASLVLAYEQSKSVIGYIERQYGNSAILNLLAHLENGDDLEEAVADSLGITLDRLEKQWLDDLESTPRWLVFLAGNIYGILFFLAAVLTFLGFIRIMRRRKRVYEEWEE